MPLLKTFELYLHRRRQPPQFEALTCADELTLMAAMRERTTDPDVVAVEAFRLGEHIATVSRKARSGS